MFQQVVSDETNLRAILKRSEVTEIRAVELDRIGNQVVLRGVVGSFYYKQLAQELVRKSAKDLEIENQICVEYAESELASDWRRSDDPGVLN